MNITASDLYSFIKCPHRVWRDAHDDPSFKDDPNEFVQMLWDSGTRHEKDILLRKFSDVDLLDLSDCPVHEKFEKTIEAMRFNKAWIYQGRLEVGDLVGIPDLLKRQSTGEYLPVDIKSGMAIDGDDDTGSVKYKSSYAVQLGLYVDALIRLGYLSERKGAIIDSQGTYVVYDLEEARGKRNRQTWWELYLETYARVREIKDKTFITEPALASDCKMCEWYTNCKSECVEKRCLSLVSELGRSRKEALKLMVQNIDELSRLNVEHVLDAKGKTGIPGIGETSLLKYQMRAKLLTSGTKDPIITGDFSFPNRPIELFFDIEADPTQDIVYLHGVVERRMDNVEKETFHAFVTEDVSLEAEKKAWQGFWDYIRGLDEEYVVYYYTKYERTQYRLLAQRYPDVATEQEVEDFYHPDRSIDLYFDIVKKYTEWPTYNYSVKALAQHLGFQWRDKNPSGAASIQWFNEWCQSKDDEKLQRILDYNEDDCVAMIRIKDGLSRCL